ncbi:MAG TPA: hypothetical protein VEA69_10020 [Tepidisphaeraceae bacterium]|nr:hypothetical protein [Tepidisphaeraceae bacterium]
MSRITCLIVLTIALSSYAAEPAPPVAPQRIALKDFRVQGILPRDVRQFAETYAAQLTPAERAHLADQHETFRVSWDAWCTAHERNVRQALVDLSMPDAAKVADARKRLTAAMANYPSSFIVFRTASAKLAPANAVRLAHFLNDYHNGRDVWLKKTQDMTAAIKASAFQRAMLDTGAADARKEAIAVRQSLKPIRAWKDTITAKDDPQLTAISRLMDYYERVDSRTIDRVIDQAPTTLGDDFKKIQHEVLSRMPKRPEIVAE